MLNKATVVLFVGIVFGFAALLLLLPKNVYSDDENRYLATFPEISLEKVMNGQWMDELEQFVDDQFPARLNWIELKTNIEMALGKKESNGVYITDEGHYIESFKQYDEKQLQKNVNAINAFSEQLKEKYGLPLQVMLVPTASTVLSYKLPAYNLELNQYDEIQKLANENFDLISVNKALEKHKEEYIYYYTDHHWTSLGAYYSYKAWKKETLPLEAHVSETLSTDFLGTLYSKVKVEPRNKDTMMAHYLEGEQQVEYNLTGQFNNTFYERSFLNKKDKYSVYFNGNQPVTKIKGYGSNGKLLIIKDSYANTFAQFAVADYSEVHLIDLRSFSMPVSQYIDMMQIDEVLLLYNYKNFTEDNHLYLLR